MFDKQKFKAAVFGAGFPSQRAFAKAVGVHESEVSRIVHGKKTLSPGEKRRWGAFLGVDPDSLRH